MKRIKRSVMSCSIAAIGSLVFLHVGATDVCASEKPAFVASAGAGTTMLSSNELRVALFNLDLKAHDYDDDTKRHYGLAGMPVRVIVHIVNTQRKNPDAYPVQIASNWIDQVVFTVSRSSGSVVTNMAPQFLSYSGSWHRNPSNNAPEYALYGVWLIDDSATVGADGDYVVSASWRGLAAKDVCSISFRPPVGNVEKARIQLAKAKAYISRGEHDRAILLLDEIMSLHGKDFGFWYCWAMDLKGEALWSANRLEEALVAKEAWLAIIDKNSDGKNGVAQAPLIHIAWLKRLIAEKNAGGVK